MPKVPKVPKMPKIYPPLADAEYKSRGMMEYWNDGIMGSQG
jgi:hypothetical protein